MEFLTGLIIGISIGFVWGVWRATQSFIERIITKPEEIKEIMHRVAEISETDLSSESEPNQNAQPVRAEFIDNVCYLYDSTDNFLAQGPTVTDAITAAERRFPGVIFTFRTNESNESHQ